MPNRYWWTVVCFAALAPFFVLGVCVVFRWNEAPTDHGSKPACHDQLIQVRLDGIAGSNKIEASCEDPTAYLEPGNPLKPDGVYLCHCPRTAPQKADQDIRLDLDECRLDVLERHQAVFPDQDSMTDEEKLKLRIEALEDEIEHLHAEAK
jgi:hypothetical protein